MTLAFRSLSVSIFGPTSALQMELAKIAEDKTGVAYRTVLPVDCALNNFECLTVNFAKHFSQVGRKNRVLLKYKIPVEQMMHKPLKYCAKKYMILINQ